MGIGDGCGRWFCPYCEREVVAEEPRVAACCEEVGEAWQCGESDEGHVKQCEECREKEHAYWASHFGIRPGMSKAERQAQLAAMDPRPVSDEQMDQWRKLK